MTLLGKTHQELRKIAALHLGFDPANIDGWQDRMIDDLLLAADRAAKDRFDFIVHQTLMT